MNTENIQKERKHESIGVITHILNNVKFTKSRKEISLGFTDKQLETLKKYYHSFLAGEFPNIKSYATMHCIFEVIKKHTIFLNNCLNNKHYLEANADDIKENFAQLKEAGMKDSSITTYKVYLKMFYNWLGKEDAVKWVKATQHKKYLEESKLLTEEDITALLNACNKLRDRCIIMMLYEGCIRAGELVNIRLNDITIDEHCIKVDVSGKTGKRSIILIDSLPYLQNYINNHPYKNDPNHYLFSSEQNKSYGNRLLPNSVGVLLSFIVKRSGLTKKVYPHLFRHSGLNMLAKKGFNERDLRIYAGWSSTSNMPDVYLHYGEKEVSDKILNMKGVVKDEKKEYKELLKPKKCPKCEKINPADSKYCNCGMALDIKQVVRDVERREEADNTMNELFKDDDFKQIVKTYLIKKQQEGGQ